MGRGERSTRQLALARLEPAAEPDLEPGEGPPGGQPPEAAAPSPRSEPADALFVSLQVLDPEVVEELRACREGRERDEFALAALRIGVLSLKQVRGQLDAQTVRSEVDRMVGELRSGLAEHQSALHERLGGFLREYFDPTSGRFAERVDRLVHDDGELARVIRRQVSGDESALARTLESHLGPSSPLLRLVDPENAEGLVSSLGQVLGDELEDQRERILSEFSLDNRDGSLARLVRELTEKHGKLTDDLGERLNDLVREFSLDDEASALSRLVRRVERAQAQITEEFSLDSDASALARLRRELLEVTQSQTEKIASMEKTVAAEMAALAARRVEALRTPLHGLAFEDEVATRLERMTQGMGDHFERTGQRVGLVRNRKVGDVVIEIGPEHRAAGARIVFEAKEDRSCTLAQARTELELARKNRGAAHGVFVFSRATAPEGLRPLERIGDDLYVVWDRDESASDVFLEGALSVARALSARGRAPEGAEVDFPALERAIREIERQAEGLDEIRKSAQTIESSTERIQNRVRLIGKSLLRSIETLDAQTEALRRQ